MRTSFTKRLDFETRNVVIISHDSYMVASKEDIEWSIQQGLIVLVLTYFAPNMRIVVYDMNPREITSTHAMRIAKHCLNNFLEQSDMN